MKSSIYTIGLIFAFFCSCSSGNEIPLPEEAVEYPIIGAYDEENRWIYAQMNHYYLWREDLPDSLSCDYATDPVTFYKSLLSPKDRFSYCMRNTAYSAFVEKADYGFAYQEYLDKKRRRLFQVLYVTAPELKLKLHRGEWLLPKTEKLGHLVSFEKGTVKNGIFESKGKIDIAAKALGPLQQTVLLDSVYSFAGHKVGYLCYLEFDDVADLETSFQKFHTVGIDELILDLRYNPGGYVSTCKYLCNSIIPVNGYGQIFQQCTYNDRLSAEYEKYTGNKMTIEYYNKPKDENLLGSKLYGLNLKQVYILTSQYTASASEATILCLKPYMEVIVIGEQTYGKGVGSWTISDRKYKYMLQPIILRYHNANMETTPEEGIPVDIELAGGYETVEKDLGDVNEPLLATALFCIKQGTGLPPRISRTYSRESYGLYPVGTPSFFKKNIIDY